MDKGKVIRKALRLAGYNLYNNNLENSEIYKQAASILEESKFIIQRNLSAAENTKIAVLSKLDETKLSMIGDFDRFAVDFDIFALPHDFISYVGSSFSDYRADVQIMSGFVFVKKRSKYSILDLGEYEEPWFVYKAKLDFQDLGENFVYYTAMYVALELLFSFKAEDTNKISTLRKSLEDERMQVLKTNNKRFALNVRRGGLEWR